MSVIDTIVFDVDGVLIDVSRSFTQAVKETVGHYVEHAKTDTTIKQQMLWIEMPGRSLART